jgi:hypothetical protein
LTITTVVHRFFIGVAIQARALDFTRTGLIVFDFTRTAANDIANFIATATVIIRFFILPTGQIWTNVLAVTVFVVGVLCFRIARFH